LARVHDELRARFRYGWDGDVVITLWIHDELVCCCRPEIAEQVGEIMVHHAKEPAEFYHLRYRSGPTSRSVRLGLANRKQQNLSPKPTWTRSTPD
jgi:hypothetical protein